MFLKQLFDDESSTYTYVLADEATREAVIIDPVKEHVGDYLALLARENLKLKYVLDTHVHADHVTGAGELRDKTHAPTGIFASAKAECVSIRLQDGGKISFGGHELKIIHTPGHTPCSACFLVGKNLFTGDALLIDSCGRTDFQGGSAEELWDSVTGKLFTLPDETVVYPGHDYKSARSSTIGREKTKNSRFAGKTRAEFVLLMSTLNLPLPKRIQEAVPANEKCGKA